MFLSNIPSEIRDAIHNREIDALNAKIEVSCYWNENQLKIVQETKLMWERSQIKTLRNSPFDNFIVIGRGESGDDVITTETSSLVLSVAILLECRVVQ